MNSSPGDGEAGDWSPDEVSQAAVATIGTVHSLSQLAREHLRCTICYGFFQDPVALPCSHVFCRACALRALQSSPCCPLCKGSCRSPRCLTPATLLQRYICILEKLSALVSQRSVTDTPAGAGSACDGPLAFMEESQSESQFHQWIQACVESAGNAGAECDGGCTTAYSRVCDFFRGQLGATGNPKHGPHAVGKRSPTHRLTGTNLQEASQASDSKSLRVDGLAKVSRSRCNSPATTATLTPTPSAAAAQASCDVVVHRAADVLGGVLPEGEWDSSTRSCSLGSTGDSAIGEVPRPRVTRAMPRVTAIDPSAALVGQNGDRAWEYQHVGRCNLCGVDIAARPEVRRILRSILRCTKSCDAEFVRGLSEQALADILGPLWEIEVSVPPAATPSLILCHEKCMAWMCLKEDISPQRIEWERRQARGFTATCASPLLTEGQSTKLVHTLLARDREHGPRRRREEACTLCGITNTAERETPRPDRPPTSVSCLVMCSGAPETPAGTGCSAGFHLLCALLSHDAACVVDERNFTLSCHLCTSEAAKHV